MTDVVRTEVDEFLVLLGQLPPPRRRYIVCQMKLLVDGKPNAITGDAKPPKWWPKVETLNAA